jgi:putative FmdB family regulatory protein
MRRLRFSTVRVANGEATMPQYNFLCPACKKEFSKILTISEYEKGKIVCSHCNSTDVEQRWAAFYAVTSKKS